jgi:hypothetical protein
MKTTNKLFYFLILANILIFVLLYLVSCGGHVFVPGQDEEVPPPIICCLDKPTIPTSPVKPPILPVEEEEEPEEETEENNNEEEDEEQEEDEDDPVVPPEDCKKQGYYVCHLAGPNKITLKLGSMNAIWAHLNNHEGDYLGKCTEQKKGAR